MRIPEICFYDTSVGEAGRLTQPKSAEKVISYYSFKGDVILDPFAGIGTVGEAAVKLERRFVLI